METSRALLSVKSPPLDPRVLSNVVTSYEGETLQVAECDVPVYHGKGTLTFKTGFTYVGDFIHGRMHGTGRIEWQSGVVYEGDFTHNEITGRGTYWWPNGSSYVGDVKRGKRHGHGIFLTGDRGIVQHGESYEQVEDADKEIPKPLLFIYSSKEDHESEETKSENGLVVAQSNARYDGEWANGLPHGYGELVFDAARHIRYEGQFVKGKREGRGHMHYADGSIYTGEWRADIKCGQGMMTWMALRGSDDVSKLEDVTPIERYDGEWENDCQHGFGRHVWLVNASDAAISSRNGISVIPDKNWYEGEFYRGRRHGHGVFFYANGARYEGEWNANVKDGYGLFFYEDGRVFVGLFRHDRSVEGAYATASARYTQSVPLASFVPPIETQPSSSSTISGIMLFIHDLLSITDIPRRDKAQKAVENAALRLNTELRALYRGCIKESRRSSTDLDDTGTLLESFECRQLLSQCGFYFTSGQLECFLHQVRKAQRASVLSCASSMGLEEHFLTNLPAENRLKYPTDPRRLEVVPWDELVLYREFVELLVRIAHSWVVTAETDGLVEVSGSHDSVGFLADVFSDLYDEMIRERHEKLSQTSATWLTILRSELMGKKLHSIFSKHHDRLQTMYSNCAASRQFRDISEQESNDHELSTRSDKCDVEVSIRSVLAMLRHDAPPDTPVFTDHFHVRHALSALNKAFAVSSPPLKSELLRSVAVGSNLSEDARDNEPDAFFLGTKLVFSEFLDAIAIVLFTKQHLALEQSVTEPSEQTLPLHVLVDQFMHSLSIKTHPVA